ncbi:MAG TPA: hypothetical protein VHL78_02855 [Actinomycetota bacterium]|nr:hypothetical protein [Actinomycetota bacterium]
MDDANRPAAHCPACGAEYRAGFDVCADDGTPLVPGPRPEAAPPPAADEMPPAPGPPRNWQPVARFVREEEARLLVGRLEAEGIEARLFPEDAGTYYGKDITALLGRPWEVLVPEERIAEAALVIQAIGDE